MYMPLIRLHISCLALFLSAFLASGQEMPALGVADEIKRGSFPNGLEYYLVSNASEKGFADFALVTKKPYDGLSDRVLLDSLPHFGSRPPYRFLADNGVGYSQSGYIVSRPDARIVSLQKVPVYDTDVADSTLMMMLDVAATSRAPQAVIVSGDIDVAKIRERMDLLSMMVPKLDGGTPEDSYEWVPRDSLRMIVTYNSTEEVAAINAIFNARRLPASMMNTLQPLVTEAYSYILGRIVATRIEDAFREGGIPLARMRFDYHDSSESSGDEYYSFSVFTSAGRLDDATAALASVLSSIDKNGVTPAELEDTKFRMKSELKRMEFGRKLSNAEYVQKCIASYLYGSNLASEASLNRYIMGRSLPADRELSLFNGFAAAVLDSARNLTLRYDVPYAGVDRSLMRRTFFDAWASSKPGGQEYKGFFSDTSSVYGPLKKSRLRVETTEPVSGGKMWTFANGVRVVFKKMDTAGEFHYALMLRGGLSYVPDLHPGESAFVEDMLGLSTIAGMRGRDFMSVLSANGITMNVEAGLSDMRIYGMAPKNKFPLLMRALLAISRDRVPDAGEFEYYRNAEALRIDMGALSPRNVNSLMDSIMRPNYFYTDRKRMENLHDDLPERAERYFASEFAKVNDGMLVLTGDLDEDKLKKELSRTVGGFDTHSRYSPRPKVSSRFASGSVTYMSESLPGLVGGGEIGVNVGMSAALSYSIDSYIAFKAAAACVEKELVSALAGCGAYAEVSDRLEIFPAERMFLYVNCHPCRAAGLPASVEPGDPLSILDAVRRVTSRLDSIEISAADLQAYKEVLVSEFERLRSDPEGVAGSVLVRYSEGKDLVTSFSRAVDELTAEDISGVLSMLQQGAEVEYVII